MRILIVDDHEVIRRGVRSLLASQPDFDICGEAVDGRDAVDKAKQLQPDLIVMDVSMPNLNGLEATRIIRQAVPRSEIVILSQHDSSQMVRQAFNAGAHGYVVKTSIAEDLINAIETVGRHELFFDEAIAGEQTRTEHTDPKEVLQREAALQQALRESEERYRALVNATAQVVWRADAKGNNLWISDSWYEMSKTSRESAKPKSRLQWVHPDDRERVSAAWAESLRTGNPFHDELRLTMPGGDRYFEASAVPVRNGDGSIREWMGADVDITDKKQIEEELRLNRERLSLAQKAGESGTFDWDIQNDRNLWSPETEELYGFTPGTFGGTLENWAACVLEDDLEHVRASIEQSLKTGEFVCEWRIRRRDNGQIRWMSAKAKVLFDGAGKPSRMIGVNADVTEQKEREAAFRENESRIRLACDAAELGMWARNVATGELSCNEKFSELFGLPKGSPVTDAVFFNALHPEERDNVRRAVRHSLETGEDYNFEYRVPKLDGTVRWIESTGKPEYDHAGNRVLLLGVARDITSRKSADEHLQHQAGLLDMATDAIMELDDSDTILYWNKGAERLYGWTKAEARGQDVHELLKTRFPEPLRKSKAALKKNGEWQGELVHTRRDGTQVHVASKWTLGRTNEGVATWLEVNRDITAEQKKEEALAGSALDFEAAFEQAAVGMVHTRLDGRCVRVNRKLCEIVGYAPAELLQLSFQNITHPDDVALDLQNREKLIAGEVDSHAREKRYIRKDGSVVWVNRTASLVRDASGAPKYIIGVIEEITERKKIQRALRDSEERRRLAFSAGHLGGFVWEIGTPRSQLTSELIELFGLGGVSESSHYDVWLSRVHAEDKPAVLAAMQASADSGAMDIEYRYLHPQLGLRWLLAKGQTHARDGRRDRLFGVVLDITDRKQIELALQQSEQRLRLAYSAANIGTWEYDAAQRSYRWSPEAYEIFGIDAADPLYFPQWLSRIDAADARRVEALIARAHAEPLLEIEYRYHHPQRGMRWIYAKGRTLSHAGGNSTFGIFMDLTDRKNVEMELWSQQRRLDLALSASKTGTYRVALDSNEYLDFDENLRMLLGLAPGKRIESCEEYMRNVHPDDVAAVRAEVERSRKGANFDLEYRIVLHDGTVRWLYDRGMVACDPATRVTYLAGACTDITSRKMAQHALQAAHDELEARVTQRTAELEEAEERLRGVTGSLLQLQDEERRRIARELHDSTGQMLAGLGIHLSVVEREAASMTARGAKALTESMKILDEMTRELRTISHLLHPPLLDEAGLEWALRWFVEGFAERSKLCVDLKLVPDDLGRFAGDIETAIFRIVQECLTNVHKHSGSTTASVSIVRKQGEVHLEVRDNGKGVQKTEGARREPERPGVGIAGMRERVRQLGGKFKLESCSSGTVASVDLPLRAQKQSPAPKPVEIVH